MTEQTTAQLAAIRERLERADRYPLSEQQIGSIIIALDALTDIVERLAEQIGEARAVKEAAMKLLDMAEDNEEVTR